MPKITEKFLPNALQKCKDKENLYCGKLTVFFLNSYLLFISKISYFTESNVIGKYWGEYCLHY